LRLCTEYVGGGRDLKDFMGAIGHNIRLSSYWQLTLTWHVRFLWFVNRNDLYTTDRWALYWSSPPSLLFDIRAVWRSDLSARLLECRTLKMMD